jgi:aldose 1-epimerase
MMHGMTPDDLLHIASGAWQLEVQPARGGAVTAVRHRGRDVLVSTDPGTADAMGTATFALIPYPNRIAHGHINLDGRHWTLPRNLGNHPHPLHGTGWKRAWQVTAQLPAGIDLALRHEADVQWPWAFEARQQIRIVADAIRFELVARNLATEPAPLGVGFHPAFAACAATRLAAQLEGVWTIDADSLPATLAPASQVLPELPGAVPVLREKLVDHCFTGWSRELAIANSGTDGDMAITLSASPAMQFLQLYMPPGRRWFCAEPMSQMPDAINRRGAETGLRFLAPGESLQVWMQIAVREQLAPG